MHDDTHDTDDTDDTDRAADGSRRRRTVAVAAAVGVAGLVAGGLAAGTLSAASADSGADGRAGYGVQRDGYVARPPAGEGEGGPSGRMGGDCPESGEGRPPAPPSEQDNPPSTEDSNFLDS